MRRRPSLVTALALALALGGCSGGSGPAAEPGTGPRNLLLVTVDTLRADHLGCYGYFRDTSPRIDALAARSLLFERCSVPMATTLPSHVSLLTGAYPLEHGVLANVAHGGRAFLPSPGLLSAAQVLADCGYRTAAFTSAKPLRAESGVDQGFQLFDASPERERRGNETLQLALGWLQEHVETRAGQPFFLWLHLFDPHDPYQAPPRFRGSFQADAELEAYMSERRIAEDSERHGRRLVDSQRAHDAYDEEIRFVDALMGRLLDRLEELELEPSTLLCLVGDHGEGLGQHDIPGHGYVWDEHLRAPLLISIPGEAPRRVVEPVSSVDVFPTLLSRLEPACVEPFLRQSSGVDLLAPGFAGRPVFGQSTERLSQFGEAPAFALQRGRWKLLRAGEGPARLYDLERDPHELQDQAGQEPDLVRELEAELERLLADQLKRAAELGQGAAVELDAATLRALEALGYTGGEMPAEDEETEGEASADGQRD